MEVQKNDARKAEYKEGCWNVGQAHRTQAGKQERDEGQKGFQKLKWMPGQDRGQETQ